MTWVLFVCWHNAARSQMAEAFFEQLAGAEHAGASAGTHPAGGFHPFVVEAMREVGIDLRGKQPHALTPALVSKADLVVRILSPDPDDYWGVRMPSDPDDPTREEIARLRDEIRTRVTDLIASFSPEGDLESLRDP